MSDIHQQSEEQRQALANLRKAYHDTFTSPSGQIVLDHLRTAFHERSELATGPDGKIDATWLAVAAGQRDVVVHIQKTVRLGQVEKTGGQQARPKVNVRK